MYSCTLEKFLCEFILCSKGRLREMDFRKHVSKPCYFLLSAATTFFRRIGEIMDFKWFWEGCSWDCDGEMCPNFGWAHNNNSIKTVPKEFRPPRFGKFVALRCNKTQNSSEKTLEAEPRCSQCRSFTRNRQHNHRQNMAGRLEKFLTKRHTKLLLNCYVANVFPTPSCTMLISNAAIISTVKVDWKNF